MGRAKSQSHPSEGMLSGHSPFAGSASQSAIAEAENNSGARAEVFLPLIDAICEKSEEVVSLKKTYSDAGTNVDTQTAANHHRSHSTIPGHWVRRRHAKQRQPLLSGALKGISQAREELGDTENAGQFKRLFFLQPFPFRSKMATM